MAGKPKPMSQVKQILRMRFKGEGIKTIARNLQISKNTVKEYIRKVEASWVFRSYGARYFGLICATFSDQQVISSFKQK